MKGFVFVILCFSFFTSHAGRMGHYKRKVSSYVKVNSSEAFEDYLNSLSEKELIEYHNLRKDLERETLLTMKFIAIASGAAVHGLGMGGVASEMDKLKKRTSPLLDLEKNNFRTRIRHTLSGARAGYLTMGLVGVLVAMGGVFIDTKGKGLGLSSKGGEANVREQILRYTDTLDITQVKDLLKDMKRVRVALGEKI